MCSQKSMFLAGWQDPRKISAAEFLFFYFLKLNFSTDQFTSRHTSGTTSATSGTPRYHEVLQVTLRETMR